MPEQTPIGKFLATLKSGETNTTTALEHIFNEISPTSEIFVWLKTADLSQPLPTGPVDVRKFLREQGLSNKEIDHIDGWLKEPKEAARDAVVAAVTAEPRVAIQHRWGITHGPKAVVDLPTADNGQTLTYLNSHERIDSRNVGTPWGQVNVRP